MMLTIKDLYTSVLAFLVFAFSYNMYLGNKVPFITGYRSGMFVLLVLGIAMCATGARTTSGSAWVTVTGGLAIVTALLIVAGLITGAKMIFFVTSGAIIMLWVITTIRHALNA